MIYTAIEALKEKDGSSKRAISKYIEHVYRDQLPNSESHQNLLTHHLKRLKSEGLLQMIKNSYIIPRSTSLPPSPPTTASPSSRPRGRPRKAQTPVAQTQAQDNNTNFVVNNNPFPVAAVTSNNNSSSNPAAAHIQTQAQQNASAEPVWAALGLNDEPVAIQPSTVFEESKRGRGRPKKGTSLSSPGSTPIKGSSGPVSLSTTPSRGRGRPPGSKAKSKRRPGRPPKIQPETLVSGATVGVVSGGSKRRPGRPPKNQQQNPTVIPFAAPVQEGTVQAGVEGVAVLTPRSRGRPRKNVNAVAAVPVAAVAATGRGRGRGRGRGGVAGRGRGGGRGRGRPRLNLLAQSFGKRPVGRPKKRTTPATASAPENAAKEDDLKRKLEHFQGKVKESLAALRPHFNHESPVTAIAAIQELEILVAMDLNEPLKDETLPQQQNLSAQDQPQQQQPQQQQQQLPQPAPQQQLPPPQIVAHPQVFPPHYPLLSQEYHYQQQQPQLYQQPHLYQPPPPQQNQFHP